MGYKEFINQDEISLKNNDARENLFNKSLKHIENEEFINRSKIGSFGFSRKRKILFKDLVVFLTQKMQSSLQRSLNRFYKDVTGGDFNIQYVTKGALTQARSKLKHEAFIELNHEVGGDFYNDFPYIKWKEFRLVGADGSTLILPNHPSVKEEFGEHSFGPKADSLRSLARVSILYDVLNLITIDAQIAPLEKGEGKMLKEQIQFLKPGDLLLCDRGYPSLSLMFELHARKIDFCIRMTEGWWLEVRKMLKEGEKDKIVIFKLPKADHELMSQYQIIDPSFICRLIVIELPDGKNEILCTSLLDKDKFPIECFSELYHNRWNIEEGYKLFKDRIEIEQFSGKTALAVKQDFYAKIYLMSLCAALAFPIEEKVRQETKENKRLYKHKINRTNALSMLCDLSPKIFYKNCFQPAMKAFDHFLLKTTEIVRPNRSYLRKKNTKQPPAMNYKQL